VRSHWPTTPAASRRPLCSATKVCDPRRPAGTSPSSTPPTRSSPASKGSSRSIGSADGGTNQAEYPDPRDYDPVTKDEVDDAIAAATACATAAEKLLAAPQLGLFR
jgi:hypothetical protein